jgi:hypothetical protein
MNRTLDLPQGASLLGDRHTFHRRCPDSADPKLNRRSVVYRTGRLIMSVGDRVKVRVVAGEWMMARVELVSSKGRPLIIRLEEGLQKFIAILCLSGRSWDDTTGQELEFAALRA